MTPASRSPAISTPFGRKADDEELAAVYEYLTHLPGS
jgi:hypothetical protein